MATTDPLTGATIQDQSDSATGGVQIGNVVKNLRPFLIPRFTTTTARDNGYTSFVSGGGTMADGMLTTVGATLYRRIGGNWRIDRNRIIQRVAGLGGGTTIASGGSAETGFGITALATFTLYEACTVGIVGEFRAGPNPANTNVGAQCTVKINTVAVGNVAISRLDMSVPVIATVALAAGTHSVAMRVDAVGGGVTWVDGIVTITEGIAE